MKTGDAWSYRADGVDLGTAWRQPGYDTSTWATGPSQLGWGNRGEATVVPSGQITQYFVRHFTVADPSAGPAARARSSSGTTAPPCTSTAPRSPAATCRAGTLTAGTYPTQHGDGRRRHHVAAVHRTRGAAQRRRQRARRRAPPGLAQRHPRGVRRHPELADAGRAEPADASGRDARQQRPTRRSRCSGPPRPTTPASPATSCAATARSIAFTTATSLTDTGLAAADARTATRSPRSTRPATRRRPACWPRRPPARSRSTSSGDVWSYRSNGVDPGTAWRQPGFDASSWASGPSQLGWGGRGETTVVPSGQITQYYVRHFVAPDPSTVDALVLRVKRDDGIAVYVNGNEVVRDNLPAGTLTAGTYPTVKVTAADGVTWKQFTIPTSVLVNGDNTIAAEVHQDSRSDTPGGLRPHAGRDGQQLRSGGDGVVADTGRRAQELARHAQGPLHQRRRPGRGHGRRRAGAVCSPAPCVSNGWTVTATLGRRCVHRHREPDRRQQRHRQHGCDPVHGRHRRHRRSRSPRRPAAWPSPRARRRSPGPCSTGDGTVSVAVTGATSRALTAPCSSGTFIGDAELRRCRPVRTAPPHRRPTRPATPAPARRPPSRSTPRRRSRRNNTASIGNGWKTTAQTVTLSPTDVGVGRGAHLLHDRRLDADGRVRRGHDDQPGHVRARTRSSTSRSTRSATPRRSRPPRPRSASTLTRTDERDDVPGQRRRRTTPPPGAAGCSTRQPHLRHRRRRGVGHLDGAGAAAAVERLPLLGRLELGDGGRRNVTPTGTTSWYVPMATSNADQRRDVHARR